MVLSRPPAARFYAAFYRWSCYTQRPLPCSLSPQYNRGKPSYASNLRSYRATSLLRQQDEPESQSQTGGVNLVVEDRPAIPSQEPPTEQDIPQSGDEGTPTILDSHLETQQLQTQVRTLMRKVPGSVAIITVASLDPTTGKHVPMGVAVSSLSTVTLDPPTISFNLKHPSQTLDAIRASKGLFRVHFLAAERGGANMVDLFCRGNHPDAYTQRLKNSRILVPRPGLNALSSQSYAPQLYGDAIRAAMECTLTHELSVADHVILVAKITSLDSKISKDPTLVYVDGGFMRADGTKISGYGRAKASSLTRTWSAWDYPLFPGDSERIDYVNRIKSMIEERPEDFNMPEREIRQKLESTLPVSPKMFGINLALLISQCKKKAGQKNEDKLSTTQQDLPVLAEFYGRLTPSQTGRIIDRARALLKEDLQFLDIEYVQLLQHLGVSPANTSILPSDILNALRADGLIDPFVPRRPTTQAPKHDHDIMYYEQAEHNLREHLRTLDYKDSIRKPFHDLLAAVGETQTVAQVLQRSRWRFHVEATPELFHASKIEIMGEVSQEDTRVVLSRLVRFAQVDNIKAFRMWLSLPWIESLRKVSVSPLITGIDIEFFLGKISHLYTTTPQFFELAGKVNQMLEPWFDKIVVWEDLQERVKQFVQKTPLRAMSWSDRDKLAAMGLHWEATFTVPPSDDAQPLSRGHILDTLVAKELKNHYGNGSDAENRAIATWLKERYNYTVHRRPVETRPEEASKSSSDAMRDAMLASLNVDVVGDKPSEAQSEGEQEEQVVFRKHGVAAPRIRFRNTEPSMNSRRPRQKVLSWSGYSLDGEKKGDQ
ncbi:hypothetical protein P153DRAFT_396167 [Dothidotthia symphoricarpi CBS 119687]|uniref:Flavin reductase like domain-containing protein n=1 Tax=Dothidotthia symphoricarpi CBS 119687 TaxID=1392245 RepID=A0A6A6AFL2_9PLEO|nr:uncharacterized protein P153DRAFT_396167 [Dothidotthia symphoricarpi CBS 119687]KAF2129828.1 hypothetical protein P153DRAFT_396167 [Dothidotthia symphoricarpi CBS 119687]